MSVLSLDIGGANIKAATARGCRSVPFALWRSPGLLADHLKAIAADAAPVTAWRVTMTAELCDCFATKREGVCSVVDAVEHAAAGARVRIWTTHGCFVSPQEARENPLPCAAANWHSLATWVAKRFDHGNALLIDTGSTTTDIIPLRDGRVAAKGLTDTARLASDELVYSGAGRTPLMAMGPRVTLDGVSHGVMAEYFATTGDVYVLTGDRPERRDETDTADGRPMTRECAAARVLRMIGADVEMFDHTAAVRLAQAFAGLQTARIVEAIRRVAAGLNPGGVVVTGSGDFLAGRAVELALPGVPVVMLSNEIGAERSAAACAHAMLHLDDVVPRERRP